MNKPPQIDIDQAQAPDLPRRVAAIFYDLLLIAALLLLASAMVTLPVLFLFGEAASSSLSANPLFRLWLALVPLLFYVYFWIKGGQTLGMRAWRMRLVRMDGSPVDLRGALLRCLGAILSLIPFGLGFLWMLTDPERLTWHDRLSGTRLVMLEKK
jgi:uncharacterized RDD family membrane protein YckC